MRFSLGTITMMTRHSFTFYFILLATVLTLSSCATQVKHQGCYVADPYINGKYIGPCKNNRAHGRGRAVGVDTYAGDFVNGIVHGHGTYVWSDGDKYIGEFRHGKIHGRGVMINKDGSQKSGLWENNQFKQAK